LYSIPSDIIRLINSASPSVRQTMGSHLVMSAPSKMMVKGSKPFSSTYSRRVISAFNAARSPFAARYP
jgi:hypothetical protein